MFQFSRFPLSRLCVHLAVMGVHPTGFPHSDITGSQPAHGSPMLFAVYHVLRRLLMPRHPPFAFCRFAPQSCCGFMWRVTPDRVTLPRVVGFRLVALGGREVPYRLSPAAYRPSWRRTP